MQEKDIYSELSSIRNLMERSTKFISLSGLSGVLAGFYALIAVYLAKRMGLPLYGDDSASAAETGISQLILLAIAVLVLSLITGVWLTIRQAKKKGENHWNPVSRRLLTYMVAPLITGGLFILILLQKEEYSLIAAACLIFYGLALVAASPFTLNDVKWLGFCEIALGLIAALLPGYGLLLWGIGFGLLHILYGTIMHFKYNQ